MFLIGGSELDILFFFLCHLAEGEVRKVRFIGIFDEPVHHPLVDIVGEQEGEDGTDHDDTEEGSKGTGSDKEGEDGCDQSDRGDIHRG